MESFQGNGNMAGSSTEGFQEIQNQFYERQLSTASSVCETDEEDLADFALGPIVHLKDHIERDKEDESLMRWKERLLGSLDLDTLEECIEPEVKLLGLTILSNGRTDIAVSIPFAVNSRGYAFCLKEGSTYFLRITFLVQHNIVPGLMFVSSIWKNGIRVDSNRTMLGTFAPKREPYMHVMDEETTPSGNFALGGYTAKIKLLDDDKRCYFDDEYTFEIQRDWN